ncbi:MAG: DNA-3-methyladenine glycosylase I [Candidatus Pacebacteria bacterium]|jgi:DNA-3-methyladenine glycosylase I|nr:DNA-3-methyladenine glycosylase I [bacterium]MDP6527948.1 DNA-3-methyladenine glycosylase I [Candidatus Paceibacterota bacterium]MDP6659479.1 DNA-3-methyladenine glycosylase I [Candidatus Paceibacterota bacterium]|tara:strand:+ start:9450 stop:10004 length:555 start_codon:yes stop_codon:yes gene_type:complete
MKRCEWAERESMIEYHDKEWGVPVYDDKLQFEFLILEGAQAGLSWETVLKKRENYRKAFSNFDPIKISKYTKKDVERLIKNEGIIRNRLKIEAVITNAKAFLEVKRKFGTFSKYIWNFVGGNPITNKRKSIKDIPATSKESDELSKALKKRGFKFVGSTIIYAHMQATGMVNDHEVDCFRYKEV